MKEIKESFNNAYRTEWKYNQQSDGKTKKFRIIPWTRIFFPSVS